MSTNSTMLLQFRVELDGVKPPIWRSILMKSNSPLSTLHHTIQNSMGWMESHLHMFEKDGLVYGPKYASDPDFGPPMLSDRKHLGTLFRAGSESLKYTYDFGDDWVHTVTLEDELPNEPPLLVPECIGGERACPPEDCGGIWGYENLLEIIFDPEHDDYEDMMNWLGGYFEPEKFDVFEVNEKLRQQFL